MKLKQLIAKLENWAPRSLQESYDNSGLIVGDSEASITKVLISLDCTEEVIDEAISEKANVVVAHHPILFNGIKSLTGKNYIERTLLKAIKNDIAIYAIHTNLDNVKQGVNFKIGEKLGFKKPRVLRPKHNLLSKLVFFCPVDNAAEVRSALFDLGAGAIGNYDSCSFNLKGEGTFKAKQGANPTVGKVGELHHEEEIRVEVVFENYLQKPLIRKLIEVHPYEEVAYDVYALANGFQSVGSGMIDEYNEPMDFEDFVKMLKKNFNLSTIRSTNPIHSKVKTVAWCGGSGSFLLEDAKKQGADVFVTADFKYHQFFDAEDQITILDIGHYESEQFTAELIAEYIQKNLPNFATYLSRINTNPIKYI